MRLTRVPEDPPPMRPPAVVATIGNFDGVHRGHRTLIGRVVERAAEHGVQSAVVTFDPHPLRVIRPSAPLSLLSTVEEKAELIAGLGVEHLLVWRFDSAVQHLGASGFLEQLARRVQLRRLLVGPTFALGRGRQGTIEVIREIGAGLGFDVEEVTPYAEPRSVSPLEGAQRGSGTLSSTAIRAQITAGQIGRATRALGRPPTLTGTVVTGQQVGRTLGFPTANLSSSVPLAVPADGVYACWAEVRPFSPAAQRFPAAVSIGVRPTFQGEQRVVEAFLLDFSGDLYGQILRLHFMARLRGQERYERIEALIAQMQVDVETTRDLLVAVPGEIEESLGLAADG